jgi:hypothetical protein
MKILTRSVIVLLALWCTAVMLVPCAFAAEQGTGTMQAPGGSGPMHGGKTNMDQMQTPPTGGQDTSGQQSSETGFSANKGRDWPSDGTGGNMTAPMRPEGMNENGTMIPPDFGNQTFRESGTMIQPMLGNETAGNLSFHEMRGGHGLAGNSTAPIPPDTNLSLVDPADQPSENVPEPVEQNEKSNNQKGTGQQQSLENQINSIISQLQALLSGKK